MEEVFGQSVMRGGRKVRVVKKPKLWDVRVGETKCAVGDLKAWKSVMVSGNS